MQADEIVGFRLSPQQRRLWASQNDPHFCVQASLVLAGDLQPTLLREAVHAVVTRHEILRTSFCCLPEFAFPLQVINEGAEAFWESIDLGSLDEVAQARAIEERLEQEQSFRPDLAAGSLLRVSLLRLAPQKHLFLISLPALCADARTLKNLAMEIARCYAGAELPEAPMQYADFSEWQNELLESDETRIGREYWRNYGTQLHDSALLATKLPFEKKPFRHGSSGPQAESPLTVEAFSTSSIRFSLSPEITAKLDTLVEECNSSDRGALLACWQILLWRLTGQLDFVVATSFDGRKYEELEGALGLIEKYLPIAAHLDAELTLAGLLERVEASAREAGKWQESFSWDHILDASQKQNVLPFGFSCEEQPATLRADDLSFSIYRVSSSSERFNIQLSCLRDERSASAELQYNPNVISSVDAEAVASLFRVLLANALDQPRLPIGRLNLLSDEEARELVVELNDTQTPFDTRQTIHELFAEMAAATPEATALICEQSQLSYAELNERANQLAHLLIAQGAGPESIVALCLERSELSIIAMLAVLKAGAAYLPLDPAQPAERLNGMVADSRAAILLSTQNLTSLFASLPIQQICLDREAAQIAIQSKLNPHTKVRPENLAYVIYTSGSTGRPKGVAIEHRQLLNYVWAIAPRLDVSAPASYASVSTLAADLGNTAIFPALAQGDCLHLIAQECAASPGQLAAYGRQHRVDCLKLVPSHLAALLSDSGAASLLPRQRLVLGGETASWELVNKVRQLAPECRVLNHYGPTETTVGVLTYEVDAASSSGPSLPLGRPLANVLAYVLDAELAPVPIGVTGELFIGGASVGRGYVGQAAQTAERFLPDPYNTQAGQRMYRTGDLVRYNRAGEIEFLGRLDEQVKLRGYRIELGELEAVLRGHAGVREAVVVALEVRSGEKQLVAYVVGEVSLQELQDYMRKQLPEYMIPARYVQLPKIPLTANGKVDRRQLPELKKEEREFVAPSTETEALVADIWRAVLGVERVGASDNFFELGGHSLLLIQVISKAREVFQVELPVRGLFDAPTVVGLAHLIERLQSDQEESGQAEILALLAELSEEELGIELNKKLNNGMNGMDIR
ncbi:MAG: amino acid adenylation domain-containing protein [Pyrinomonadaceae bacterium]|nr:amino acid adenylation domain-containing protein [Pyrinomonadaceae bacterium]